MNNEGGYPLPNNQSLVKGDLFFPVTCTAHRTHLFLELVELGDVVEEGGDDGGEQEELFGREVLEGVHDGEVPLDRHGPANGLDLEMHRCSFWEK